MPLIELNDVRVEHGATVALDGVSLTIERGASYAIVGANGSGKSTLLDVLAGVRRPARGLVSRAPGMRVALVAQHSAVTDRLPLTVHDTVAMARWGRSAGGGRAADRRAIETSLRAVGLEGLRHRPLASLSGGQRQRALVAQGLAREADLLLLDEPENNLDEHSQALVLLALHRERDRGATVVRTTHDPAVAADADHVIELSAGAVVQPSATAFRPGRQPAPR